MNIDLSIIILPLFIFSIVIYAVFRKTDVYQAFIDGAKDGFSLALKILPYLAAIIFAVNIFTASGGLNILEKMLSPLLSKTNIPTGVIPLFIIRPLSGSASFAALSSIFKSYGPDSYTGKVASTLMGSQETLFYTISLYLGSVGLKKTGYTIPIALICDIIGLICATFVCSLFFT